MMEKDCPLKFSVSGSYFREDRYKCSKENCEWWLPESEMCAVKRIALDVKYIEKYSGRILNLTHDIALKR